MSDLQRYPLTLHGIKNGKKSPFFSLKEVYFSLYSYCSLLYEFQMEKTVFEEANLTRLHSESDMETLL